MSKPSIDALRSTVELIDSVSQDAFDRIKALCKLTLLAMEQRALKAGRVGSVDHG